MFLYNCLTIRNVHLGRCGTKTYSNLEIRDGHDNIVKVK